MGLLGGRLQTVSVLAPSKAPRDTIFRLLKDGSSWPAWTAFERFELEREGETDPLGIGAIRVFSTKMSRAREEITGLIENREISYKLLSGLPLTNYVAKVSLNSTDNGGTLIQWSARFGPQPFGTGIFARIFVKKILSRIGNDLASEGDRLFDLIL